MRRIALLGVLLISLVIGRGLAQETSAITGGDDATLRAFIARYVGGTGGTAPVNIIVGGLPSLAFAVPTPPDTTIIGTIVRPDAAVADLVFYEILLEHTLAPAEILAFYQEALAAAGWALIYADDGSSAGGFVQYQFVAGNFCLNDTAANFSFDATANPETGGKTLINVRVQTPADEYQCQSPEEPVVDTSFTLIPQLGIPTGVTIVSNAGGGLSYYAADAPSNSLAAVMDTTLSLAQLAEAYTTQLAQTGWVLVSNNLTERSAFSTWTITAPDGSAWYGGLLLLADTATPGRYNAMVWVEK